MLRKTVTPKGGEGLADRLKAISAARPHFEATDKPIEYIDVPRRKQREERTSLYKQATILIENEERLDVVIKNMSRSGVKVEFFRRIHLPRLVQISEPTLKIRTLAEVVWQGEGVAGLKLLRDEPPAATQSLDGN